MKINRAVAMTIFATLFFGLFSGLFPGAARAGEADVVGVRVQKASDGTYRFDVTVRHADEGWDHYADAFQIIGPDDAVLGTRILVHPHVDEQPFTRSLGAVSIPANLTQVVVRARDKVHGLGGKTQTVKLPGR